VFLINPPTPEPVQTPLLSFCYLAAALRDRGHEVALLDASAPFAPRDPAVISDLVASFAPTLVGLHVKTLYVADAYALAAALRDRFVLVAGGPHATVCPEEPLRFGFRFVLTGEAERSLPALAEALDGRRSLQQVPGLLYPSPLGVRRTAPSALFSNDDLDALPSPVAALDLFDPAWYGKSAPLPPFGVLSSRGCPAACTFCCNNVTGRRFRYRSAELVAEEVALLRERYGMTAFSFFDDSFAVGQRRVEELSAALRIGKGVKIERVLQVLNWARELSVHTVVNLMFGWPDESEAQLRRTLAFLDEAKGLAGGWNARGVLVPYPGTEIYEANHERFGFTEWWLREEPLRYEPFPTAWSLAEISRAYASDAALTRNFFRHSEAMLELMQEALHKKARYTFAAIAERTQTNGGQVPAAGAR
jgi:radical SAM superfamily enzyme YgiQ (UPF0313 family)